MVNWGGGASGAASGAALGSVAGPYGAAIGGAAGGLIGLFSGDDEGKPAAPPQNPLAQDLLARMATDAQNRRAAQISGTQLAVDQTGRQGVLNTAGRLGGIASGQQAGAGEIAVNRQLGQALAQQTAAARMARGANSAIAARNAMRTQADLGLQGAGAAAQYQMQDQAQANAQLGSLYGNLYGQDATIAAQNAQLGQAAQLANQQAAMQQQGMNDAMQMQALGQMLGWDQQTINAHLAQIQQQQVDQNKPNMLGTLLQNGGNLLGAYSLLKQKQPTPTPTPAPVAGGAGPGGRPYYDPDGLMAPGA